MTVEAPRTLCVIPARGGSKRVPRKNLLPIAGVPMLQRTIEIVAASGVVSTTIVSTDDDEIAALATSSGAEVPFRRPAELADDHTPTAPVIEHALSALGQLDGTEYDYVLVVYATAVLLDPADLHRARAAVVGSDTRLAISVCRYSAPIERAWTRNADGFGEMRRPEFALTRTQDLEPSFYDAGQFYFGTSEFWTAGGAIHLAAPALIELPPWRAVDIDTWQDVEIVENALRHRTIADRS